MLEGYTVAITADRRWQEQATLFERRGATVIHGSSIRTLPMGSDARLRAAIDSVIARPPDAVIANTGVGIRSWFSAAETWGLGDGLHRALAQSRIYARGPKASGAIHSAGLEVVSKAATERLGEAVDLLLADHGPGDVVAFQIDGSGDARELERVRAAGLHVVPVPVYEWTLPEDIGPAVRLGEAVISGRAHAITFTAGPSARNLVSILREHDLDQAFLAAIASGEVVVGCVGPVCAEAAIAAGVDAGAVVVPEAFRLGPLVRIVADALAARRIRLDVRGVSVEVAGAKLTIGADAQVLTHTEARLMAALATRPNVVLSKPELASTVWRDNLVDHHAIETAIARLRKRMGSLGDAITVVHRRGYALRS